MGLTFSVGNGSHVFEEPYGSNLDEAFQEHFSGFISSYPEEEAWYSRELAWSGWESLQQRARETLGASAVPHLLAMPAWKGAYLPVDIEPCSITDVPGEDSHLDLASLDHLIAELEAFGRASGLPLDEAGLQELAAKYNDDDTIDADMDLQTYAQLLLASHEAKRARCPLWIVK